jgi:organic hydroperoxide reductase OsmC/OhrA
MIADHSVSVTMEMIRDFEFRVKFSDNFPELLMDEPEPIGGGNAPNASKVLSAAIGNCLSASLLFCLRKARVEPHALRTTVTTDIVRNERGRMRIDGSHVAITLGLDEDDRTRITRCTQLFEDFCIVTGSVRSGIDVRVTIADEQGEAVYDSAERES